MKTYTVTQSKSSFAAMVRLATPALAEESLVLMVTWTDWLLASRFFAEDGDATKAAMGLMAYVMWLLPSFFSVVAIGATALIARWVGGNDFKAANKATSQSFLVGFVFALLMTVTVWVYSEQFIQLMQLKGEAAEFAVSYLKIVTPIIPMIMCSQIGAACLRGAGDTFSGFAVKCVVVVVNILVSTFLVTGWLGAPKFGWTGIAIGTATGYTVGGTILTVMLIRGRAGLKLEWRRFLVLDKPVLSKMFKIGLPGGFDVATLMFSQLLFLGLINSLGKSAAAAHGLAVQIEACAFLPGAAFQVAAATLAGQYLGAGRPKQATVSVLQCLAVGGIIMSTAGMMVFFFGVDIATFFTNDRDNPTTQTVAELLRVIAFALPSLAVVMVLAGGFRGAGDTRWLFFFTTIGFFGIRIPLALFLCYDVVSIPFTGISLTGGGLGIFGAWYAMAVDLLIRSGLMLWRFFHGGWRSIDI
jgi:putative MATE family efflux protein